MYCAKVLVMSCMTILLYTATVIPVIEITASLPVLRLGDSITLSCNVTRANPTEYSTFTWTHDSTALPETGNTLTLSTVRESDLGMYRCEVTNSAGTGSGTFNLAEGKCKISYTWSCVKMLSAYAYMYTATCAGDHDCTVQSPTGVPVTTIIAAVCGVSTAMAIFLVLVADITILMIWKFKKKYR